MKILIIGGGQVGSYVSGLLLKADTEVTVIENRPEVLEKIKREYAKDNIIEGDGTDPSVLLKAGIQDADVVAAITGKDEVNLVVSTIAKYEFGVERVIARVNHPRNSWLFTLDMGVDVKVNQAEILAHLIVDEIDLKNMLTLMKLNRGAYSIIQMKVTKASSGLHQAIKDLSILANTQLIAIERRERMIIPKGDTVLEEGDNVIVLTDEEGQEAISKII